MVLNIASPVTMASTSIFPLNLVSPKIHQLTFGVPTFTQLQFPIVEKEDSTIQHRVLAQVLFKLPLNT